MNLARVAIDRLGQRDTRCRDLTRRPSAAIGKVADGTVAERTNAVALKATVPRGTEGSNPSRSAFGVSSCEKVHRTRILSRELVLRRLHLSADVRGR
jgi:hypothetical protein